jgi:hypothetical protein
MKSHTNERRLVFMAREALAEFLGVAEKDLEVRLNDPPGADLIVEADWTFVIEVKGSGSAAQVAAAAKQVQAYAARVRGRTVPLVAVPFMGEVGRKVCADAGVGWLDLSGNAHIVARGLRVIVEGRPNRFRSVGRPPNLFAPKGSRIVRWLLVNPSTPFTQREIARSTGLDEGFVSRLVTRLEKDDYLVRDQHGAVRPKDPALLLDAWREVYQFSKHTLFRGHVAARSGDGLLREVASALAEQKIEHAATGLAAAWAFTRFAAFRIATLYLADDPPAALLQRLAYREDPRGANLWLVVPNDAGVFEGAVEKDGIRCVHPVQVYLDLKDHPERAREAAQRLRADLLTWRHSG